MPSLRRSIGELPFPGAERGKDGGIGEAFLHHNSSDSRAQIDLIFDSHQPNGFRQFSEGAILDQVARGAGLDHIKPGLFRMN